jgi:L-ascorbate metabolism protein UlaG (beta-lactamase superfamily)
MYRHGLGDCFLLALPDRDGGPHFVLIDCGVVQGTPDAESRMWRVAQDIRAETRSHLDAVVATHPHWDHVSGFLQARSVLDTITVDNVWLAWTEDPSDSRAHLLRHQRSAVLRSLQDALTLLDARAESAATAPARQLVRDLLEQFGRLNQGGGTEAEGAVGYLLQHGQAVRFCRPGDPPLTLLGLEEDVRFHILGPPTDEVFLDVGGPPGGGLAGLAGPSAPNQEGAFAGAVWQAVGTAAPASWRDPSLNRGFPFDPGYQVATARARQHEFFQTHYGFEASGGEGWRRIDDDWLDTARVLALGLDRRTKNTSLVLAVELLPSGKVLLFPGDAQAGSWLSWDASLGSAKSTGSGERRVSAADLLARTVLYKASHHASHHGTPRAQGLERMTNRELVALVPVDESTAKTKHWDMPFPALLRRLAEKTDGRVLRADQSTFEPPAVSSSQWEEFRSRVTFSDLFIDYTMPD